MGYVKEVFFMRHGRTLENMAGILIGQGDPPLTEEAREEIRSIRQYVVEPDVVFSSDLRRASETARLLFPDREIMILSQLRERNGGELQGKPVRLLREINRWGGLPPEQDCDEDASADTDVESFSSLRARAEYIVNLIKDVPARRVLVVSHGGFLTCVINTLLPDAGITRSLNNMHYHKITLDDLGNVVEAKLYQEWSSRQTP